MLLLTFECLQLILWLEEHFQQTLGTWEGKERSDTSAIVDDTCFWEKRDPCLSFYSIPTNLHHGADERLHLGEPRLRRQVRPVRFDHLWMDGGVKVCIHERCYITYIILYDIMTCYPDMVVKWHALLNLSNASIIHVIL